MFARRVAVPILFFLAGALPALAGPDDARIKTEVENRYREWVAAASGKNVEAVTSLYDDDAVLMPKAEEGVVGKAAIAAYYRNLFADPHYVPFTGTFASTSFSTEEGLAIDTLDFDGDLTRAGKHIHFRASTLLVWKKQKDGSWKIFRYMFDEIPAKKSV